MKTGRINYVGSCDIEYTEIRPIRPNQSVTLAGLGVTGSKVLARTKDRRYRSTQGAGYSDGLVIHSRPHTGPWTDNKKTNQAESIPVMNSIYPSYDMTNQKLYEDEIFIPMSSSSSPQFRRPNTSLSRTKSVSQSVSPSRTAPHPHNVANTYDMFFSQHLQNIVNLEEERPSQLSFSSSSTTPVTARYKEASCQTPTDLTHTKMTSSQTNLSVPKIIEDCLEEELEEDNEDLDLDVLTDDELDMIGDFMVKESLDTAASNIDHIKV